MFTGLVQRVGEIVEARRVGVGLSLCVRTAPYWPDLALGESIAVDGVCLTVTSFDNTCFWLDVSPETLERSTLGTRIQRGQVNLERALRLGDRLGGHLVLGHVDGVGRVLSLAPQGAFQVWTIQPPPSLLRYIAEKGSICVDGVSLTVSGLKDGAFTLALIPTTLKETTLLQRKPGDQVNLEVDVISRYVERLMSRATTSESEEQSTSLYNKLLENGFIR